MQAISTGLTGEKQRAAWQSDSLLAAAAAVLSLVADWLQGANKLVQSGGDSDSLMRLVQVRDLLAGQGWFDLVQHRLGVGGGVEMHWSRLVDAPIAGLIAVMRPITGSDAAAEMAVAYIWPGLLLAIGLFLIVRMARQVGGDAAAFPAAVLALAALHFMAIFAPGSFDHHNLQLALMLGVVAALMSGSGFGGGVLAGALASVSLAVGMETAPVVAALAAAVALVYFLRGAPERDLAAGFGVGFSTLALAVIVVTLQPGIWTSVRCDAWSGAQASLAVLAGLGLAAGVRVPGLGESLPRRLLALTGLGGAIVLFAAIAFPACLADPYATLDPMLKRLWLDWVSEAQGVLSLLSQRPGQAAGYLATPLLAQSVIVWCAVREPGFRRCAFILAPVLIAAIAVSVWQVRGAIFAVPLAVVPLAMLVARARKAAAERPGVTPVLLMALAWLVSFNIVWNMGVTRIAATFAPIQVDTATLGDACYTSADFNELGELAPANVLAVSNLGASILVNSDHRVFAGPYHRNVEGNLAVLRAFTAEPETARPMLAELEVGIIAHCPGNDETQALAAAFPRSLLAEMRGGSAPEWLQPMSAPDGSPLVLFRFHP
ncbi:MAG: GtrA family protein [Rhizobiaceae bacterium]|nr:GtrA family protein [Rhizobiaceae bacterium]